MVFAMVVIGGVTRLTRSGLSMVEWRPQGSKLPSTDDEWAAEFEKYKAFPEYQRTNKNLGMTVDEFKSIYFMEWLHRMWGRSIGLVFALPLLGFAVTRKLPKGLGLRLTSAFGLGGLQGLVGWWMVKSGLDEKLMTTPNEPRVSAYRLTAHLAMAVTVYSLLVWTGMDLLQRGVTVAAPAAIEAASKVRGPARIFALLAGITLTSGGFVAGLDAGHAYNDWPMMAGKFVPEQFWEDELGVRNFTENTATVQFDHRMLAYSTTVAAVITTLAARRGASALAKHAPRVKRAAAAVTHAVGVQVALGISTLMMYVPVPLGAAHQSGALVVWTCALYLLHALKQAGPRAAARVVAAAPKV